MLNKDNVRELAYLVSIDSIEPMNADKLECAKVGGWNCVVGKNEFHAGDIAVFFEIDSKLPDVPPFSSMDFLRSKNFKITTQKIRGVYSQGLLVPLTQFPQLSQCNVSDESRFVTKQLGVTYAVAADNQRKSTNGGIDKYKVMAARHQKIAKKPWFRWLMRRTWGKKLLYLFLGRKKTSNAKRWPDGKFAGVSRTDQDRIENRTWVLADRSDFIRTQKCDGSSGTFILERKRRNKFEFYVCSRNVRMLSREQECFFGDQNYYWDVAIKYDIEAKMKQYLMANPKASFICWQGEICGPAIQQNPHSLSELHLFCFHWTDSVNGRLDIREAAEKWRAYDMETVPIDGVQALNPDLEQFKLEADGYYDPSVCEGASKQPREGFVYYKVGEPTFSFKNVSRKYLLRKGE